MQFTIISRAAFQRALNVGRKLNLQGARAGSNPRVIIKQTSAQIVSRTADGNESHMHFDPGKRYCVINNVGWGVLQPNASEPSIVYTPAE